MVGKINSSVPPAAVAEEARIGFPVGEFGSGLVFGWRSFLLRRGDEDLGFFFAGNPE